MTIILQTHGIYELSTLKTYSDHLIKAQVKKGPCGPTKGAEMKQNSSPKRSQQEA